ncbi:MAG: class I SAM-dependent methyltransferase [Pseudomonadota bacterium]
MHPSTPSSNFDYLLELRNKIGPVYGSEDLCMLLYSIVKREKPAIVVELGTGLGVTTAWIAAAMQENQMGTIYTVDNGTHFATARQKEWWSRRLDGRLAELQGHERHGQFLDTVFARAGVADRVRYCQSEIDLHDLGWLDEQLRRDHPGPARSEIDIVFSDYSHSAANTARIVASFLPRMTEVSSIFIDSASTHLTSYYLLERLVQLFNQGRVPKQLLEHLSDPAAQQKLQQVVASSEFKLMHLVEKQERAQNSTAWLRTERATLIAPLAISLH